MGLNRAIEASGITCTAGRATLLDGVAFALSPGELVAVVGPNGAGKSTLLSVLAGDLAPDRGEVRIGGEHVARLRPAALSRLRAVLPQQVTMAFPFTVAEVVAFGVYGRRQPYCQEQVIQEAMAATEVEHLAGRAFPTLSGGERARVSLARVLAQGAPTLLLDEPTAALDLKHQEQVMRAARERALAGDAVLVVLHDLNLAAAYAGRIALMSRGRIVADGTPAQVLDGELLSEVYGCEVRTRVIEDDLLVLPRRSAPRLTAGTSPRR